MKIRVKSYKELSPVNLGEKKGLTQNILPEIFFCFLAWYVSGTYSEKFAQIEQDSTITIKSLCMITYSCQNFGVRDVCGKIPKSIYQASYLLPSDFPNNFS